MMDDIERLLQPGSIVPVDIKTTGLLVREIMRLRAKETAMTIGAGKYDDLCTIVRKKAKAKGVIVIVIAGEKGGGFSCQFEHPAMQAMVPDLLDSVSAQIRKDGVWA